MLSGKSDGTQERKLARNKAGKAVALLSCIEPSYCGVFSDGQKDVAQESHFSQFAIKPCKCGCQFCPDCRVAHMVMWRERLRPVVETWEDARMLTLTIDRKKWSGPEDAYLGIMASRSISEFVRKLSRKRCSLVATREFLVTAEFHPSSPEWLHWHLVVRPQGDWFHKPQRGWKAFGDRLSKMWGHGFVDVAVRSKTASPEHAMNYLTKYIAKQDVEPPEWVLNRAGNFRKFSTSRGFCGPVKKRKPKATDRTNERKTAAERVASCAQKSRLVKIKRVVRDTMGKREIFERQQHVGKISMAFAELLESPEFEDVRAAALAGNLDLAATLIDQAARP